MSYEQFVRYKQQLRAITSEFLKTANMLDDDHLEIVVARMVDRVSDDPDRAFQDKYRGLVLAILTDMRDAGEVKQQMTKSDQTRIQNESADQANAEARKIQQSRIAAGDRARQEYLDALKEWKRASHKRVGAWKTFLGLSPVPRPEPMVDWYKGSVLVNREWTRGYINWSEYLIDKVSDFPIVPNEQRPADKTPEECTPTRDEIKRLTYQG
ncbi:hypothetical protein OAE40_00605 [Rubripirellula sp.]|nr:hypothetical protein [Rubripirellula sp.]MDB4654255.1 hypothetical protein [Rubripirellula sp.]